MRIIVAVTDAMYRQLTKTINSSDVIVFKIYHLVRVLNYCTNPTAQQKRDIIYTT